MNKYLIKIDKLHKKVEKYFEPPLSASKSELENYHQESIKDHEKIQKIYNKAGNMLREVVPTLSPEEVIEGYKEGSILLHRALSGFMCDTRYFHEKYIPIMIEAIQEDKSPTIYLFLLCLARKLPKEEIVPLVIRGLDSQDPRTRDTALRIVDSMMIREAIPKVREVTLDPEQRIREQARDVLDRFIQRKKE